MKDHGRVERPVHMSIVHTALKTDAPDRGDSVKLTLDFNSRAFHSARRADAKRRQCVCDT